MGCVNYTFVILLCLKTTERLDIIVSTVDLVAIAHH